MAAGVKIQFFSHSNDMQPAKCDNLDRSNHWADGHYVSKSRHDRNGTKAGKLVTPLYLK